MKNKRVGTALGAVLLTCSLLAAAAAPVAAQPPGRGAPPDQVERQGGVSPAELQRLFDAYVVMQAQQELQLTDEQYPQFLARVKALQEVRRRTAGERLRVLGELRRLTLPREAKVDEAQVRAQLKALDDVEARGVADVTQALDSLSQVLDIRQQARFRLFEEQMERRKVDLLMRARQANRARPRPQP